MTATLHRIEPRPASRHMIAARMTLADDTAPEKARLNAADMLTMFGDDADLLDAEAYRKRILAETRTPEAPFAWVDEPAPRINGPAALLLIGAAAGIVMGFAVAAWGGTVITKAAANVLAAQDGGRW